MFLNPLGLLALLGVPAVIALHLFRRRFERRRVSALFLWEAQTRTALSGRRRENLLRSPSFWSELLLALLLGLAFAGPRACGSLEARHLVVVLDGSASMSAGADLGSAADSSPRARALARVRDAIDALPSGSRVTVIESGSLPRILIGPAAFPREVGSRLDEYEPSTGRHDLGPAAALAAEVAGEGAVTLFTDRFEVEGLPKQIGVESLGIPLENLAITRAHRSIANDQGLGEEQVLLTVANFSHRPRSTQLELVQAGQVITSRSIELDPGARKHLSFQLSGGTPAVEARLEADAMTLDDSAWLAPAPRRELRLATDLDETARRYLGLERPNTGPLERWLSLVTRSVAAESIADADLAITHGTAGGDSTWNLSLESSGSKRIDLIGPYLLDKRHQLLEGVTLDGVVWSASPELSLPGQPLISAGDVPLLTEEKLDGRIVFHANLDWKRSSIQRSPDWPILLHNLAQLRRERLAGPRSTNIAVGEVFYFQTNGPADYVLEGPGGSRELRALSTLAVEGLERVGQYRLLRGEEMVAELAVHFGDDAESDLRELSTGTRESGMELAAERGGSSWTVMLLGALALCALLADFWFLRPRGAADLAPLPSRRSA
jgi:hypothetical protein